MKKLLLLLPIYLLFGFQAEPDALTKKDRKAAAKHLKMTLHKLKKTTKKLSEAQLTFRPSEQSWSIKDNVEHLIEVEGVVWGLINSYLEAPVLDEALSKEKANDKEILKRITTRNKKFKAPEALQPKNKYDAFEAALSVFSQERTKTIDFIKTTSINLRKHGGKHPRLGVIDVYQLTLFVSGHTARHLQQIEEIKSHPTFPK